MLQRIHDSLSLGRWVVAILLGLIAITFIFWGVDFGMTGPATFAAKVNGEDVSLDDFNNALQNRQNQYQQIYRSELPDELRRELRRSVIDELVRNAALKQRVNEQGYRASAERVDAAIRDIAAFQVDGVFNEQIAMATLANEGYTREGFRAVMRDSLKVQDLESGIVDSTFLTPAEFRRYIELYNQRREVAYALFDANTFATDVTIDDAAVTAHYDSNQASYQTDETVDLEYVELALADVAATVEVTDDDLRAAYDQERERFETAEERHARHILFEITDGEDAARTAAEAAEARLRAGEDFAAVAAELSADAGTKAQGGDLGWMARGTLVGPFEDALFALQVGEISAPVKSEFGFHIIRLDELRAGEVQPFEAVRDELAAETRTRLAEDDFFDRVDRLSDAAFDAGNELATVASELDLPLKTAAGFSRSGDPSLFENSAGVVQAAFGDELVESGRNSDVIELAEDHVVVLRVAAHQVPTTKPLDEVRDQIREELTRERSQQLAEEAAQAFFAEFERGADPVSLAATYRGTWQPATWLTRTDAVAPTEVLAAAFGMPKVLSGVVQREVIALANGGQAVIALSNVEAGQPSSMSQDERDQRQQQLSEQAARAELTGYAGNVRDQATVRIPPDILEPPVF